MHFVGIVQAKAAREIIMKKNSVLILISNLTFAAGSKPSAGTSSSRNRNNITAKESAN
jgi:hypothetical protein